MDWQCARAVRLVAADPAVWSAKSEICDALGRFEEAIAAVDRAIQLRPTNASYWTSRGDLLAQTNRTEEALQAFARALELTEPMATATPPPDADGSAADESRRRARLHRTARRSRGGLLLKLGRPDEARADILQGLGIPERDPSVPARCVDLSAHYTVPLQKVLLGELPKEGQDFAGVPFDVRGAILLRGSDSLNGEYPGRQTGIRVGQRCRRLHFLHSVHASRRVTNGAHLASYVVHYADGATQEIRLLLGEDFLQWLHPSPPATLPRATAVWPGRPPSSESRQLWKRPWDNPRPDTEIVRLDFRSTEGNGSPFLIAVTAE